MQFLGLAVFMSLLPAQTNCLCGGPASAVDFVPKVAAVTLTAATSQTEPRSRMLRCPAGPNLSMEVA